MEFNYSYLDYIDKLANQANKKILSSEFLEKFHSFNKEQLQFFFLQFHYFVNKFPQYIGAMIYNSDNPIIRNILTKNLIDELGGSENIHNNNIKEAHSVLYRNFLYSLKIDDNQIKQTAALPCTRQFISTCDQIYLNSPLLKSLSAFGPGNEGIQKWDKVYAHLKSIENFSEEDLKFFSVHIEVDGGHSGEIIQSILLMLESEKDLQLVKQGIDAMINARFDFYRGLYVEINNLNNISCEKII